MIHLTLTDTDASTLSGMLTGYLSDLRMEIADTEQLGFRQQLKEEEVTIKKILVMLTEHQN
ncbi:hypothetical protein [Methanosphaerula palustris]|uniref:Uncharacterized protein n=1 Tax=Methanosphaerula palustris (strain ATCC BAA-1556 / DSM 19958 / E1-9c) TaxID=521011 RepID=B8GEM0_METPE|nr:hypothetical protein [Methanosphaerula palustris]ACL17721.1 conserved hypothetical protein [Methanosphaerula palustris E1-9c]